MPATLANMGEINDLSSTAVHLFRQVAKQSADLEGVSRPAFSDIETGTLQFLMDFARAEGLAAVWDQGRNVVFSLPEHQTADRFVLCGSHVDSVPRGGNFDGLAGVLSGIMCLVRARREGNSFSQPVKVIAMRGEESAWFGPCYVGSKALLGVLSPEELAARHRGDGRTLSNHMEAAGIDMEPICAGRPIIDAKRVSAYLEVHIEQGPVLVERNLPTGIVSGIRGNFRYRKIACYGEAGHSGAVPLAYRHDPVLAMAELLNVLDAAWHEFVAAGRDLVITSGMVSTDQQKHALTRIPDFIEFSLDIRSQDSEMLDSMHSFVLAQIARIERERAVRFDTGEALWTSPAICDEKLIAHLGEATRATGSPVCLLASGGGHDAAVFSEAGIPSGMIFIRNRNGSHNPQEAMAIEDFDVATDILYQLLINPIALPSRELSPREKEKAKNPMFKMITDIIREKGNGSRAYHSAATVARKAALADPERAAGYFILAVAAQEFADLHYGEATQADVFDRELDRFQDAVDTLDQAFGGSNADQKLKAISMMAIHFIAGEQGQQL